MFWPVLASSLTTVAAFLPLMMISGPMGKIMYDIPFVMICVLMASLTGMLPDPASAPAQRLRAWRPDKVDAPCGSAWRPASIVSATTSSGAR
jgi:hypothetical protein